MKFFCCILFLLPLTTITFSQKIKKYKRDSSDMQRVAELVIPLKAADEDAKEPALPFEKIKIKDVRFDTSLIGLYAKSDVVIAPGIKNYKINLNGGVEAALNRYFDERYSKRFFSNGNQLVCFIKRLYVAAKDTIVENINFNETVGEIGVEAEAFVKSGDLYYPAFKIDTVINERIHTARKDVKGEIRENLLQPLLDIFANKINKINGATVLTRRAFIDSAVYNNYYNRFNIPIVTDTFCVKGIYKNFDEFKSNKPSITEFKVKKEKYNSVSLLDAKGNYLNTMKLFGFCDGKQYWIQHGNFCYSLIKAGNAFKFYWTIMSNFDLRLLMALDMETGKAY